MEIYLMLSGDVNGKEIQKRGLYIHIWLIHCAVQKKITL